MDFKHYFLNEAEIPGYAQAGLKKQQIDNTDAPKQLDVRDIANQLKASGATSNLDLKTQQDDFEINKKEAEVLLKDVRDTDKLPLKSQLDTLAHEYQMAVATSANAEIIKKIKDKLRGLKGDIKKSAYSKFKNPVLNKPELFPTRMGATEKALSQHINISDTGEITKNPNAPVEKRPLTPMDRFKNHLRKNFQTEPTEPEPEVVSEPETPRMSVSDVGNVTPKPTNLDSLEKFLTSNEDSIDKVMYDAALAAIQKAKESNDPEDIKIAKELVTQATD